MSLETEALIRASVVEDVLRGATAKYWLRRAEEFERAKPVPGEFHGQATREQLSAAWRRCHASAEACRNRARVAELGGESWDLEPSEPVPTRRAS